MSHEPRRLVALNAAGEDMAAWLIPDDLPAGTATYIAFVNNDWARVEGRPPMFRVACD